MTSLPMTGKQEIIIFPTAGKVAPASCAHSGGCRPACLPEHYLVRSSLSLFKSF